MDSDVLDQSPWTGTALWPLGRGIVVKQQLFILDSTPIQNSSQYMPRIEAIHPARPKPASALFLLDHQTFLTTMAGGLRRLHVWAQASIFCQWRLHHRQPPQRFFCVETAGDGWLVFGLGNRDGC